MPRLSGARKKTNSQNQRPSLRGAKRRSNPFFL
jgi:hypothetical protein